jgi:hypothetical protein
MPVTKNMDQKQTVLSNAKRERKAPGTRLGTLADWREGSQRTGTIPTRHGRMIRDGR